MENDQQRPSAIVLRRHAHACLLIGTTVLGQFMDPITASTHPLGLVRKPLAEVVQLARSPPGYCIPVR